MCKNSDCTYAASYSNCPNMREATTNISFILSGKKKKKVITPLMLSKSQATHQDPAREGGLS